MAEPKLISVVDPSGVAGKIPESQLADATAQGYAIETPEMARMREYQTAQGSSISESAKAAAEHAASTLTFGGSDVALSQIPGYREQRQLRDETFPISGVVGDVGASLVPMLGQVSKLGTAAKIAKTAGAPLAAVSRGATTVGRATESLLAGSAPGAFRGAMARTIGTAAAGAVEGAVIGAGQALSESAIQDKQLTAELLLAHMGSGAAVGGVLGGGLQGVGETFGLAGKAAKGAARYIPGVGELLGRDADALANSRALTALGFQRSDMNRIIKKFGPDAVNEIGAEARQILELDAPGALKRGLGYEMGEGAERVASLKSRLNDELKEAYRITQESGFSSRADRVVQRVESEVLAPLRESMSGGDEAVIREIKRELKPLYRSLESADKYKSIAESVPSIRSRLEELGQMAARGEYDAVSLNAKAMRSELSGVREAYSKLGMSGASNRVRSLSRELGKLEGTNGKGIFDSFASIRDSFNLLDDAVAKSTASQVAPTIEPMKLWELARKQADRVKHFGRDADPKEAVYRQYWGILKDELSELADRAGVGPQLREVNQRLKRVIALDEVASKAAGFAGNRQVSLTDTIASAGGATAGAFAGGVGSAVGALAGGVANRFARSAAGDYLLGAAASRYAGLRKAIDASDAAAAELGSSVRAAITPVRASQRVAGVATRLNERYETQAKAVRERNAEQQRLLEQLNERAKDAQEVAPELTGELTRAASSGQSALAAALPSAVGTGDIRDDATEPQIPESQKAEWLRRLGVVKHPMSVVEATKSGTLTGEQIETLRKAYPALYERMRGTMLTHLGEQAKRGNVPDYAQRAMASVFTGEPVDVTYKPEMIRAYQQMYAQQNQPQQAAVPQPSASLARAKGIAERKASSLEGEVA